MPNETQPTESPHNQPPKEPERLARGRQRSALRHGLTAGSLPPGCNSIAKAMTGLRTSLENAALDQFGAISVPMAAAINTAIRFEKLALLCQRWLRKEGAEMDASTRLQYARQVAEASAKRDKAIEAIGLRPADDRDALDWSKIVADQPETVHQTVEE